ncbi:type II toxin-antitoxin system YafO family toxin [Klebsiella pneumoniae]|uniref:Type II toxin-antitoxin system YafO family toxin n=1 Tax=Klebsiella pneumoniae TaxID=573 RepID=A0A923EMG7_KLEPN|nr:type II toxin-antitoxin system YafO family toxin [Klebsiella pneumoniae]
MGETPLRLPHVCIRRKRSSYPLEFALRTYRTERRANFHRTSNHYLVYTEHMWDSGRYLLMGVVTPAHEKMPANNNQLLSYFAEVAERFHSS